MLQFTNNILKLRIIFGAFFIFILSCENKSGIPKAIITVPQGKIKLGFFKESAPNHVSNFIQNAEDDRYDGTTFHRISRGFVVQGGDPKSKDRHIYDDGTGGGKKTLPSEFKLKHFRGSVAMAKLSKKINPAHRSNSMQFYIALDSLPQLDKNFHTVFAYVEEGFDVLDSLVRLKSYYLDNPNSSSKKITEMELEIIYEIEK